MENCGCRSHEDNKKLVVRLNRIEGQVRAIKGLLESEKDCECMELLNQIKSATSAMRGVWEIVAARHLEDCVVKMGVNERNEVIEQIVSCLKELK